jgi:hypothetical protein
MVRILKLYYQDHYSQEAALPSQAQEIPTCVNMAIGELVYEDKDWFRLCHERADIDGGSEQWSITSIRKADVTAIQELTPKG